MEVQPAQDIYNQNIPPPPDTGVPAPKPQFFKKFLPIILVLTVVLLLFTVSLTLLGKKSSKTDIIPTPTKRPTATPYSQAPTIAQATIAPTIDATVSGKPVQIGRLSFIKDGDIYNSNFDSYSILVKNSAPAGDRLSWSTLGNFLAWRLKSEDATASSITVFSRKTNKITIINPENNPTGEVLDYVWSPDEKEIALLYKSNDYKIYLNSLSSDTASSKVIYNTSDSIKQIIWPKGKEIIFSGKDGIYKLDTEKSFLTNIATASGVLHMKLSPNRKKILYSVGSVTRSNLFVMNIDGSEKFVVNPIPNNLDLGNMNLTKSSLEKGFIPHALWFPDNKRLMVGYHYLPNLPLVGIYDLEEQNFTALTPFLLYASDMMISDKHLMGIRAGLKNGREYSWQLSLFTLEDNSKLGLIRVIPSVSSFTFYNDDAPSQEFGF